MCAQLFSCGGLFAAPWTIAHHALLSIEFLRQEYWSGLPLPTGDLPDPEIEPTSLASAGRFITTWCIDKFHPKITAKDNLTQDSTSSRPLTLFSLQTISPLMHCIILTAPIGVTSEQEVVNPWIPRYDTGVLKSEISALRTLECGASIKFLVSEIATCLMILFEIIYKFCAWHLHDE